MLFLVISVSASSLTNTLGDITCMIMLDLRSLFDPFDLKIKSAALRAQCAENNRFFTSSINLGS